MFSTRFVVWVLDQDDAKLKMAAWSGTSPLPKEIAFTEYMFYRNLKVVLADTPPKWFDCWYLGHFRPENDSKEFPLVFSGFNNKRNLVVWVSLLVLTDSGPLTKKAKKGPLHDAKSGPFEDA